MKLDSLFFSFLPYQSHFYKIIFTKLMSWTSFNNWLISLYIDGHEDTYNILNNSKHYV